MNGNSSPRELWSPDNREWLVRYRRQLTLEGFGMDGQRKLDAGHVVVVGAGGLGAPALLYLAAAGVGHITVIDDDLVELSNLHRQVIHTEESVGQPKVDSAVQQLHARNSSVTVTGVRSRVDQANAVTLLEGADVVLDGSDNFATRYAVSRACAIHGIPHVWGSILGFDAQLSVFWAGHGPIYDDIFPAAPPAGSVPSCAEAGVLGPLVGVIGTAMALEAVKIIGGVGQPLTGTIGYFSGGTGRWEYIPIAGDPRVAQALAESVDETAEPADENLPVADQVASVDRVQANVVHGQSDPHPAPAEQDRVHPSPEPGSERVFIDVREPAEFQTFHIPGAHNLPLSQLRGGVDPAQLAQLRGELQQGREVMVYCAAGVRSAEAVRIFDEAGVAGLHNVPGGISALLDEQEKHLWPAP